MTPDSALRRGRRRRGETLVRTAPVRILRGTCDDRPVREPDLVARVGWLCALVAELGQSALDARWNAADAALFTSPSLPAFAYKAWSRVYGPTPLPAGLHVPSRVNHMALEQAGRALRSAAFRRAIVAALIAGSSSDADAVSVRNLGRRLARFEREHGRKPVDLLDLEPAAPRLPAQAPLAATDRQLAEISDEPGELVLRVMLPLVPRPARRADWAWHAIPLRRPAHLAGAAGRPTLRISGARALADLPVEVERPLQRTTRPLRVMGFDWGVNVPLVGALVLRTDGGVVTDGRPVAFRADALLARSAASAGTSSGSRPGSRPTAACSGSPSTPSPSRARAASPPAGHSCGSSACGPGRPSTGYWTSWLTSSPAGRSSRPEPREPTRSRSRTCAASRRAGSGRATTGESASGCGARSPRRSPTRPPRPGCASSRSGPPGPRHAAAAAERSPATSSRQTARGPATPGCSAPAAGSASRVTTTPPRRSGPGLSGPAPSGGPGSPPRSGSRHSPHQRPGYGRVPGENARSGATPRRAINVHGGALAAPSPRPGQSCPDTVGRGWEHRARESTSPGTPLPVRRRARGPFPALSTACAAPISA